MAIHNAVADDEIFLQSDTTYIYNGPEGILAGQILIGGNTATISR
jgi:hypothetical protein